ncbi:hypothetical protein LEP1GSC133_4867 [Leptospira borgpetersenii serovar Pomona str. 200901868]|uniref:Uncharacterized protein n=2 Tax=Leptospira TaxID=171 RepID=A0AA87MTL3_9LEPT|nr:hypothetical protein LEP1GSC125_0941 [Leptospira mayottensis 200901122]EMO62141.1 hypothetical protein LEP1GSC133_4867 [Leptospira borgpetersenii serovar Pomona str. 200901868]
MTGPAFYQNREVENLHPIKFQSGYFQRMKSPQKQKWNLDEI